MNKYLIVMNKKRYATNADNMMEAEDKFCEYLFDNDIPETKMVVDILLDIDSVDDIIFF